MVCSYSLIEVRIRCVCAVFFLCRLWSALFMIRCFGLFICSFFVVVCAVRDLVTAGCMGGCFFCLV